jgi:hypothetical protein
MREVEAELAERPALLAAVPRTGLAPAWWQATQS